MVIAQYYNFVRFGKAGYRRIMEIMQQNAESLAEDIDSIGKFQIIGTAPSGGGFVIKVNGQMSDYGITSGQAPEGVDLFFASMVNEKDHDE